MKTIYDFSEQEMNGAPVDLKQFKNKVVLIVNTASKCGLAPQLEGLEALYKKNTKMKALSFLAFPLISFIRS